MIQHAEIIAVGSELLTPHRLDTNSPFLTERLNELGIDVRVKAIVGDDREAIRALLLPALDRADLVILTGGLGPTDDDVTRDAVASTLGLALEEHAPIVEAIRRRFERRGLEMPEINRRQALVPQGAVVIDNPAGTAPGLVIEREGRLVVLLPGPPRELRPVFDAVVRHHLAPRAGRARMYRRVLRITGRTESHVEEVAQPIYSRWRHEPDAIDTTILASPGQIELHLRTRGTADDEARLAARLEAAAAELRRALGADVFSEGASLEEVVGQLLRERRLRVGLAESCTGGLATSRLTDVPGSSDYVDRAVVCYSNRAKIDLLGVPPALIEAHGAVSEEVASAMATGLLARSGVDIAVAITGIAGPGGGREQKPVGTVAIALAWGGTLVRRTHLFPGSRDLVKLQASQAALDLIRRTVLAG